MRKRTETASVEKYHPRVYDDDDTLEGKLEAIREYCLTLTEWRYEEADLLKKTRGRLRKLEAALDS
jgi:hypothetical protein